MIVVLKNILILSCNLIDLRLNGQQWFDVLNNVQTNLFASHLRENHSKEILVHSSVKRYQKQREIEIDKVDSKQLNDVLIVPTFLVLMICLVYFVKNQFLVSGTKNNDDCTVNTSESITIDLFHR